MDMFFLMAMAEDKTANENVKASVYITSIIISLAKASHMAELSLKG